MSAITEQEMMNKAKERGYSLTMTNGTGNWFSFMKESRPINLQVYLDTGEFCLSHMKGIILITTQNCGSFMNDDHFNRIERDIKSILFDLL